MRESAHGLALLALLIVGACRPPATALSPGLAPPVAASAGHAEERRVLGLEAGRLARYRFSAWSRDTDSEGTREARWTCEYSERVAAVADRAEGGVLRTVVEVRREVAFGASCAAPQEDWGLTPRPGRLFYVIGGEEVTHGAGPNYATTRRGVAVYLQEQSLDLGALDDAGLVFVLPLQPGVLWHDDPETRHEARGGQPITVGARRVDGLGAVVTPAGRHDGCYQLDLWAAANVNDTSWVCPGLGEARHLRERFAGSLRYRAESELIERR